MAGQRKRVEAPLLRQYVQDLPRFAKHAPQVPGWVPWVVFLVLASITWPIPLKGLGFLGSIVIACLVTPFVKWRWKPTTPEEAAEKSYLDEVNRLRYPAHDGSLRRRFPEPVVLALERIAGVRAAALARIELEHPVDAALEAEAIETRMRVAVRAALKAYRRDDQGRREWLALCENREVVESLVRVIEEQELKMGTPSEALTERLAALRELEGVTAEVRIHKAQ